MDSSSLLAEVRKESVFFAWGFETDKDLGVENYKYSLGHTREHIEIHASVQHGTSLVKSRSGHSLHERHTTQQSSDRKYSHTLKVNPFGGSREKQKRNITISLLE